MASVCSRAELAFGGKIRFAIVQIDKVVASEETSVYDDKIQITVAI
jgi:hypothetical protein